MLENAIRHSVYLERLKSHEVNELVAFFNKSIEPDLLAKLERYLGRGTLSEQRLKELYEAVRVITTKGYMSIQADYTDRLRSIGVTDAQWYKAALSDAVPIEFDFRMPHLGTLKASLSTNLKVYGKPLTELFDGMKTQTAQRFMQQVSIGIAQGESYYHIVRRIRGTQAAGFTDGILNESRRNIESVVRTSVASACQTARSELFKENDDIIKGEQLVATLDGRTTETCMGYDGKVYPVGEGPRPPFHFNCRTQVVPILKSWKELGINLKEAPDGTRSSMNGQVSDKLTYGSWLKTQPKEFQDDVLGKTRAEYFRSGQVSIDRFTRDGKLLSLEQLRKIEKIPA